jgi:hypothetical protein
MTVTSISPRIEQTQQTQPTVPAPRAELPPMNTNLTVNLHVNSDTRIEATRHVNSITEQEYLAVSLCDALSGLQGVTVFIHDADVIRLIDALQSTYVTESSAK